jgi:hypothetical protein
MIKKGSFPRRRLEKEEPSHMTNERRKEESMDNPAEYMLQFFNCEEREDGFDDNISKAFGQMHDTETCLNDLLSMNVRRLDTAKSVMPGIWEKLWASYANAQGNGALVSFDMKPRRELTLDAAQRQALETIADKTPALPMKPSPDNIQSVGDFLDEAIKAVREAIQKLFGLLYVAETQTSKPGIWEKLKSAAVKPFVAALLAEAAKQVASGTAQAFLQITS